MGKIEEIKEAVKNSLPEDAQVTKIEIEGPEIAVYTQNPKAFFENENLVAKAAFELKKMLNVRTDKSLLKEHDIARETISKIVPADAGVTEIEFEDSFSEVVIEALKPGLVIGKEGSTSKQIILETGWTPKIIRAPTQKSDILRGIRHHLHSYHKERKQILKKVAERIYRDVPETKNPWMRLMFLGGAREVGRSAILAETNETKILLDCGINVASYQDPYPMLEAMHFPLSELDAVVITHAHLDHSGFLPYLYKSGYEGPVYCTEPTRDLMALLQFDYIDVLVKEGKEPPYTERDVKEMIKYCITRDYRKVTDIAPDMRLTLYNAAHILGSASAHLHIGEGAHNLVYTSDIKFGFTRLFDAVDAKYPRLESLIIESTYGGKMDVMPNRQASEERLLQVLQETILQNGCVLIPVFAVGRAQEIMLVLENFYRRNVLNFKCYVDGMTLEASSIHTAYPEHLREGVRRRILQNDSPFTSEIFKEVKDMDREQIIREGGSIIIASSGMLTGGPSVEYFKAMAEDPKNTLIFVGYQGEGSLGRKLQNGVPSIPITVNGKAKTLNLRLRVENIEGFSGHSDRAQLASYIKRLKPKPKRVIVQHGDKEKAAAFSIFLNKKMKIKAVAPQNLDAIRLV
ncbi:MAG: beta-CASP ribonuclease aCPSF1 [Candidatus Diapherotrites archaeon]